MIASAREIFVRQRARPPCGLVRLSATGPDLQEQVMAQRPLVIYGSIEDPQIIPVVRRLAAGGRRCAFIDFDTDFKLSLQFLTDGFEVKARLFDVEQEAVDIDMLSSVVWLRNKADIRIAKDKTDQVYDFRINETERYLKGMIHQLGLQHFNAMPGRYAANTKSFQLSVARRVGLQIPRTLISNDKKRIVDFLKNLDSRAIAKPYFTVNPKPISDGSDTGVLPILVNEVSLEEVLHSSDIEFSIAPAQFQELIDKEYEIRLLATVVGCAAFKIRSQETERGKIDWRRIQNEDVFEPMRVPDGLVEKSLNFLREAGLQYGVMDLIATPDGQVYFLECNVDGQWAWLESREDGQPFTELMVAMISSMLDER